MVAEGACGQGEKMTTTTRTSTLLTPYLCVSDARRAMDWYRAVFAAQVRGEPYVMDDGRIGHAQLDLGGAALMLADEFPEVDVEAPPSSGPRSVTLNLQLGDVDAVLRRARENGAPKVWDAEDKPYGRSGRFDDPMTKVSKVYFAFSLVCEVGGACFGAVNGCPCCGSGGC